LRATGDSPLARQIYLTADAERYIDRPYAWLFDKSPNAASRLIVVLQEQLADLTRFSERGRLVDVGISELIVPFGGSNYVIRYEADTESVFISRIWHGLEDRRP
jgi:plasmid stabilization system protein ParE